MRSISTVFLAMLAAAALPHALAAAPRSIDDCEKIQAADAYNQCLALFGPVAHIHGAANSVADNQDADNFDSKEVETGRTASTAPHHRRHAEAHRHTRRGMSRHAWSAHAWSGHGHRAKSASHGSAAHGHGKRIAFTISPGRTRLR